MGKTFLVALGFSFVWGCADSEHAPGPSIIYPTDTEDSDVGADAGQGGTDTDETDTGTDGVEIVDAQIEHPEPTLSECVRLDQGQGNYPALFSLKNKWYAFFAEGEDYQTAAMNLRVSDVETLEFGEPTTLLCGVKEMDLIWDENRFLALASRQLYAVLLESEDGVGWKELGNIAPDEPPYLCDGYPPVKFFRSSGQVNFLAMGNDYNTGIFGCTERLFFSKKKTTGWAVPEQIGDGDAVFAYQGSEQLTVVSTFGVYASSDSGQTFQEFPDGETTASQLRGTGAAAIGGRLILVQEYSWADEYVIAAVFSEDEGASWTRRVALQRSFDLIFSPQIASHQDFIAVAWLSSGSIWVMTSPDGGDTWSEPGLFDDPDDDSFVSSFSLAAADSLVGLSFKAQGVRMCLGSEEGR